MKDFYLIVKKFTDDGHEEPYYATFNVDTANTIWYECIEECDHIYYDFEFRVYKVGDFKIIKKRDKNT